VQARGAVGSLALVPALPDPRPPPGLPRVGGPVNPVAEVRAALARVLAGAEPDDAGVLWIDDNAAQGERPAVVEHGRERRPAVRGFPQAAESRGDVPGIRRPWVDRDVLNAARLDGGTDAAEREPFQDLRGEPV